MDDYTPCPQCKYENPPDNRFCGRCGTSLTSTKQLVPRRANSPTAVVRALPSKLGPTGKTLAVGLAALAAEAGLAWLRRRVERVDQPLPAAQDPKLAVHDHLISQTLEEVYIRLQEGDYQRRIFARRVVRSFGDIKPTDERR